MAEKAGLSNNPTIHTAYLAVGMAYWLSSWEIGRMAERLGDLTETKNRYLQAINILETSREGTGKVIS